MCWARRYEKHKTGKVGGVTVAMHALRLSFLARWWESTPNGRCGAVRLLA